MNLNAKKSFIMIIVLFIAILLLVVTLCTEGSEIFSSDDIMRKESFHIIASTENKDLESVLVNFAKNNGFNLDIDYAGTLDIMEKLNLGDDYDAVWASNSIWLYMLNDNVSIKKTKSTSINPVVFGVNKSKAEALGWVNTDVYMSDILNAIKENKLKFNMPSVTQTNTGATAYLGFLQTLAGNPEVLTLDKLNDSEVQNKLKLFFSGVERSSGSDEFLETMFLNGQYEAVLTYETSLININRKLEEQGKEPLYLIYTKDGVSISDEPFAYIDHKDANKLETFNLIQKYLLSNDGQSELLKQGRRVWYGGVNESVDKNIFNPEWGIDTTKYIVPIKYPSTTVIKEALNQYQTALRKPIHIVFCLDYSGSMKGGGIKTLINAMEYILTKDKASNNLLQFAEKDKITVIPFNRDVINVWDTDNGVNTEYLINNITKQEVGGGTNIYDSSIRALSILENEEQSYNVSIVLMTDGMSNYGHFEQLERKYKSINRDIPIYSIMFGDADDSQLAKIAELTNAKVFDGRTDLLQAFKQVRGYN